MIQQSKRGFGSDNHAPIHPDILKSFEKVNQGHVPSYGTDAWSYEANHLFKQHFGEDIEVFFTFNGTAANVLAMKASQKSFQSALCSDVSHLFNDECGAPEILSQTKLIPLESHHGKILFENLDRSLIRRGDQHYSQTNLISITQPTELGTLYSLQELKNICSWAHQNRLLVHMDGARIANAAYKMNLNFKDFTKNIGIDVLSFGGSKNGLMLGEALVFLNPELADNFKYYRKQFCQLPSKSRYIASQFITYLSNDLWKSIAKNSCDKASLLSSEILKTESYEITHPTESNAVFLKIPKNIIKKIRDEYFFYVWDQNTFESRLMCSWDTQEDEIFGFVKRLKEHL